jgi:hypothetical protein
MMRSAPMREEEIEESIRDKPDERRDEQGPTKRPSESQPQDDKGERCEHEERDHHENRSSSIESCRAVIAAVLPYAFRISLGQKSRPGTVLCVDF